MVASLVLMVEGIRLVVTTLLASISLRSVTDRAAVCHAGANVSVAKLRACGLADHEHLTAFSYKNM